MKKFWDWKGEQPGKVSDPLLELGSLRWKSVTSAALLSLDTFGQLNESNMLGLLFSILYNQLQVDQFCGSSPTCEQVSSLEAGVLL